MTDLVSHSALPVHSHLHPTLESKESLCATEGAEKNRAGRQAGKQAGSRIDDPSFSCIIAFFHSLPYGYREQEVGWGLLLSPLAL